MRCSFSSHRLLCLCATCCVSGFRRNLHSVTFCPGPVRLRLDVCSGSRQATGCVFRSCFLWLLQYAVMCGLPAPCHMCCGAVAVAWQHLSSTGMHSTYLPTCIYIYIDIYIYTYYSIYIYTYVYTYMYYVHVHVFVYIYIYIYIQIYTYVLAWLFISAEK